MKAILEKICHFLGSWGEPKYHHHLLKAKAVKTKSGELEALLRSKENQVSKSRIDLGNPYQFKLTYKHKIETSISYDLFLRVFDSQKKVVASYHCEESKLESWFGAGSQRFDLIDELISLEYESHSLEVKVELKGANQEILEKLQITLPIIYEYKILDNVWNV